MLGQQAQWKYKGILWSFQMKGLGIADNYRECVIFSAVLRHLIEWDRLQFNQGRHDIASRHSELQSRAREYISKYHKIPKDIARERMSIDSSKSKDD